MGAAVFGLKKLRLVSSFPPKWCLNSCSGLLCLERTDNKIWVCNPILVEWITIPPPPNPGHKCYYNLLYALGFSPISNEYKLLSILEGSDECEARVHTLGTRQWRSLDRKGPAKDENYTLSFNGFVNGSLHLRCYNESRRVYCISSFNFENERFGTLPLPAQPSSLVAIVDLQIAVLNSCLSVLEKYDGHNVKVWIMKEYGVEKSWTLMLVITSRVGSNDELVFSWNGKKDILMYYSDGVEYFHYKPLFSLNEDEILIMCGSSRMIVCYNTKRRRCRYLEMFGYDTSWVTVSQA